MKKASTKNKRVTNDERRATTPAPAASFLRSKTTGRRGGSKVWRIFHFEQRYEMPEDMKSNRKSGLNYTKRFVGINGGDEAVGYQQQMGMLCNGDGQEACMLEGLYGKLVNMAAALSRAKRGYLIDADDKPLSSAQIAKLLNISPPTMRKMIARFEAVKLLERIELPEFDLSKNEPPAVKGKKGGDKKGKNDDSEVFRKNPEKSGKKRKPLKKKPNSNYNPNDNLNKTGLTEDKEFKILTDFKQEKDLTEQDKAEQDIGRNRPQNPTNPMESEAGAAKVHYVPKPPLSVRYRPSRKPQKLGRIISGYFPEHWRDPECQQFAWDMVVSLGMPLNADDMKIRSEAGAFASWLFRLKAVASGPIVEELKQKAFEKARFVNSPKCKRKRNMSALWTSIMESVLASHGIRLPEARADPAAVSG